MWFFWLCWGLACYAVGDARATARVKHQERAARIWETDNVRRMR